MGEHSTDQADDTSTSAVCIEEEAVFDRLLANENRLLVDFYADWCGPCQMMTSTIDELAEESDAAVVKVDIESSPQIAAQYDVQSIPTFLAFHDGDLVDRLVGMQAKEFLERALE